MRGAPEGDDVPPRGERRNALVVKSGWFVTLVILSCVGAGLTIFWLLRSMRF